MTITANSEPTTTAAVDAENPPPPVAVPVVEEKASANPPPDDDDDDAAPMTTIVPIERELVATSDTVPPKVLWQREHRRYTDKAWGILYVLFFLAFIATGLVLVVNSRPRYERDATTDLKVVSQYFLQDATQCCQGIVDRGETPSWFDLCHQLGDETTSATAGTTQDRHRRRMNAGESRFDGDEGIFDAFLEAPEIIVGLLALTVVLAITWGLLLRFCSKPIVIASEVAKIAMFIYMGIVNEQTGTRVLCFFIAGGILAYDVWARKEIMFAAETISYSAVSFKENPAMFIGLLFINLFYVLNAFLFVLFFSEGFNVAEVQHNEYCSADGECYSSCEYSYPDYVYGISTFISLAYLWSVILFSKMRLCVIANIVGSWHFHPEDKPGVLSAVKNTLSTSFGTLAVSSLICTVVERINRALQEPWYKSWIGPAICVTAPLQLIVCAFSACIGAVIKMLTNFAVILHVFTGLPFVGSARKTYKIMSRHFKGGFVTDTTSRGVLYLGAYAFSIGISLLTWAWLDQKFNADSMPGGSDATYWIAFILLGLFNLWYPVLGIYIIILINRWLLAFERSNTEEGQDHFQHLWVNPLASIFVGCIAMLFFCYLAGIFLDAIDVLFLCFAIDKDNNVDMSTDEFQKLVEAIPAYVKQDDDETGGATEVPHGASAEFGGNNGAVVPGKAF